MGRQANPPLPGFDLGLEDLDRWCSLSDEERNELLARACVGDGLPLAPVAMVKVQEALATVGLGPDEIVATLPPLMRPATAASVAIWSLIAGCQPASFPFVVAGVEAIATPAFNALGVLTTTGTAAVAVVVNGPAAGSFNSAGNLLGPGSGWNGAVGRALAFITRAVGGGVPGITDMATMGQPGKYTFCFSENELASPWEPLHVSRGLSAGSSAVTIFAASGTVEVTNAYATSAGDVLATLAASMYQPSSFDPQSGLLGGGTWLVLISPEWADQLAREGLTRADVCDELAMRAEWPASSLPPELSRLLESGENAVDVLRAVASPADLVLVVGGGVGIKQTLMSAWAGGSRSVTVQVRATVGAPRSSG